MMEAGEPPSQPPMEKQQAEPYAGVAVPVNEMQPVAPVPYTGAPLAPVEAVAQESLPLPTMQAFRGARSGSVMHIQLADGRIMAVDVPPGTPPGHQIHFPVAAAPPPQLAAPAPQPPMARAGAPAVPPTPPETLTIQVPPGAIPGSVCRIGLTDGRHLDVTVPAGVQPGTQFTIPVPPGNVGAGVASVYAPETVTIQVPPGTAPGAVFRIKLTDGRDLDVTVPAGVLPGTQLTVAVPPRPVDREGRPLGRSRRETDPLSECLYFLICCPLAIICCRPELLRFVSEH